MRIAICVIVAAFSLAARPALAKAEHGGATFWEAVQSRCNATAAKPASKLGRRIAQTAIDEFYRFGGHEIDSTGRLFHFGLTEGEHEVEDGPPAGQARLGQLGWWRVMKYWRALYGDEAAEKLEVRGYGDASTSPQGKKVAPLLRTNAVQLLRDAETVTDPAAREILREAALRAAIIDTPWSAAFISYVIRTAGATAKQFHFSNAHRDYIYDAFATSAAEVGGTDTGERLYRACPLTATKPRPGDLICAQYEPDLADTSARAVRERIHAELDDSPSARSVRHTHCEVVAYVDRAARKIYTIGGNVYQAVTARKLNLRRNLKFSPVQGGHCDGPGDWTLPRPSSDVPRAANPTKKCSLNDEKWFVLLQMR
jgi:Uncharacterized protein conserved in bacteria (DUF2272)